VRPTAARRVWVERQISRPVRFAQAASTDTRCRVCGVAGESVAVRALHQKRRGQRPTVGISPGPVGNYGSYGRKGSSRNRAGRAIAGVTAVTAVTVRTRDSREPIRYGAGFLRWWVRGRAVLSRNCRNGRNRQCWRGFRGYGFRVPCRNCRNRFKDSGQVKHCRCPRSRN
jgi:hypothetical protein